MNLITPLKVWHHLRRAVVFVICDIFPTTPFVGRLYYLEREMAERVQDDLNQL